jgi:hypothetical protein
VPGTGGDPRLEKKLAVALRTNDAVASLTTAWSGRASADYVVSVVAVPRARASGTNFFIAWPGFIIFAPAWHGLDWPYTVRTHVVLDRSDGTRAGEWWLKDEWTAHWTSNAYGVGAGFGWIFYSAPAFVTGIVAATKSPDSVELGDEFALREGEAWAENVAGTILDAIDADRAVHAPASASP